MTKRNVAFLGGGVSSVVGLGAYSTMIESDDVEYVSYSGASIGAVIAICLAAGKKPEAVKNFLAYNVEDFCKFIMGKKKIKERVDGFLLNIV